MASHGTRRLVTAQPWMGWDVSMCLYLFDTPNKVYASSNQEVLVTASTNSVAKMTSNHFPS